MKEGAVLTSATEGGLAHAAATVQFVDGNVSDDGNDDDDGDDDENDVGDNDGDGGMVVVKGLR